MFIDRLTARCVPLLMLAFVACRPVVQVEEPADLVLRGGKVVTVNANQPEAEAIAVKGATILAVGTASEIESLVGPETQVIELDGRLAIPGFVEGHGHFMSLGEAKTILDLVPATTWDEIVELVAAAAEEVEDGDWILGRGWHQEKWLEPPTPAVEGSPVHHSLSAVSPNNPVILGHASGHAVLANALAMEVAGLTRDTEDPPGGELVRDGDGNLTGLLREGAQIAARKAHERFRQVQSPEQIAAERRHWVELAGHEALSKGVTSFHDAGSSFELIDFFKQLEAEGALPVRLYVMVRGELNAELDAKLSQYKMLADFNDFLTVRSIKRQIDGALGSHGAWLLEPYSDMPRSVGLVLEPEADIAATAEIAIKHGYQVNTHAIGDLANRRVLDIYQEAFALHEDASDLRWRIEHAQHLHPDDIDRFSELGVIASMQGIHCTSDGPWVPARLGTERAATGAYVWRKLLDTGAVVTNGTDVPVEDIDPIAGIYATVSRTMADGQTFYPDQSMTREEALRSYTLSNAFAAFEDDLKGSLEPGKLADIVVVSKDIMTVPVAEIPTARVDLTIVGGEIRYER